MIGDLVRRKDIWGNWKAYNPWMCSPDAKILGIVIEYVVDKNTPMVIIQWPDCILSWEYIDHLEVINEAG